MIPIELQTRHVHSDSQPEEASPEDCGFKKVNEQYANTYHFATEDKRPENIDLDVIFPMDREAMAKIETCNRLYETIKKVYRSRVRMPDSWSCSQCKIKKEVRLLLNEAAKNGITASIRNVQVQIGSFPWLWCKADYEGPHPTLWQQFWKGYPEQWASNL